MKTEELRALAKKFGGTTGIVLYIQSYGEGGYSGGQAFLARELGVEVTSIPTLLKRLVDAGHITRETKLDEFGRAVHYIYPVSPA